jgi:hypothetical protein
LNHALILDLHENPEDLEVVGEQRCLTTLFTLIDVDHEEHDISEDVSMTFDSSYLSASSLNEEESLSRDEESCHILENTPTTSRMKATESKICVHNMEQYSHRLIEEIQDQFLGDSIIDYS